MAVLTLTKYEANGGSIHSVRLSSKTVALAGAAPTGEVNSNVPAKVSKSNGEYGVRPRGIRITQVVGAGAAAFRKYATVPVLTQSVWDEYAERATVNYDGSSWTIVRKFNEDL